MAIVGIDVDGVIAENPWKIWYWPFSGKPIRNRVVRVLLATPCYIFRHPKSKAVEWIREQREAGNKVFVVSGIYGIIGWLVRCWFKLWKIPFDGIYLRKDPRVSQPLFKARVISTIGCTLFIDDREDIIKAIAKQFRLDGFRKVTISKNELGYVVVAEEEKMEVVTLI
jgi:hypothetical protein